MRSFFAVLHVDNPRRDRLALSVITILVLCIFWALLPNQWRANQNYDYYCCYEPVARNWLAGKGWVLDNGRFGASYPPGYSLLIAAVILLGTAIGARARHLSWKSVQE